MTAAAPEMAAWLPDLPHGWLRSRLDRVASIAARIGWKALTADEYVDEGYIFLAVPNIKGSAIDFDDVNYITEFRYRESPELALREGDVLLAKDGSLGIANLVRSLPRPATVNGSIAVLRPVAVDPGFLYHVVTSDVVQGLVGAFKAGMGVPHLFQDDLRRFPIPVPPLAVQRTIAHYLDQETARIDGLIAARLSMCALLGERWDALVRWVTRQGLQARPFRPSGVAWIGDVPADWHVLPLRRVGRLMAGTAFPDSEQGRTDGPIPYFKVADFNHEANGEYLSVAANSVTLEVAAALGSPVYPKGTVVFPKIGAALLSNRRRLLERPSCTDQNIMGLVVQRGVARYYYYLLQFFDFSRLRMPGPVPLLNEADAASILVPVPPDEEQVAIVSYLELEDPNRQAIA